MAISTSRTPRSEDGPPEEASPPWDDDDGPSAGRSVVEWIVVVVGAVLMALLIKTFVMQAFYIPSESMKPTLLENDRVLVNKVSYRLHDVNRGDVIVFEHPAPRPGDEVKDLIKRVIALPGEQIFFDDDHVFVNGQQLSEPYLSDEAATISALPELGAWEGRQCDRDEPCTVPAGAVWVLGDNRANSQDSRYIGPVPLENVVGRAFVTIWPLSRVGGL